RLERGGGKDLAATDLRRAPDNPSRLVDPAHGCLSIPLLAARGKSVAVVSPGGRDGKGLDAFWRGHPDRMKTRRGQVVSGRYASAERSAEFMQELILTPAVHTHELQPEVLSRHFADHRLPYSSSHAPA